MEIIKGDTDQRRISPLEMSAEQFRSVGHTLIDGIADFLGSLPKRPVTRGESPDAIQALLGKGYLPEGGTDVQALFAEVAPLLFDHSLFNGHSRFWGYVTSSAAPIGALADLLASTINPNCGAFTLSPVATEIEAQTIRWIAEMIGYPTTGDGILVSGGNMANFVCFLAARKAKSVPGSDASGHSRYRVYASAETHLWLRKAVDLFGLSGDALRWIPTDERLRADASALKNMIREDVDKGCEPFLVIGTAGSVSTGAIDPLREMAAICREHNLWFHIDGAYGGFAAVLPESPPDLHCFAEADSIAVDPHKWLYAPLEAGCALVRDPKGLTNTFSYHPPYYRFEGEEEEPPTNYYERGPQNSRGFRALKVWLALRQVGRQGYVQMISEDIRLAQELHRLANEHPELQAFTHDLSIATFRYVPAGLTDGGASREQYLNELNTELLARLQSGGEAYLSNAIINGKFLLRACIVNFRTTLHDIEALPDIVIRLGKEVDAEMMAKR